MGDRAGRSPGVQFAFLMLPHRPSWWPRNVRRSRLAVSGSDGGCKARPSISTGTTYGSGAQVLIVLTMTGMVISYPWRAPRYTLTEATPGCRWTRRRPACQGAEGQRDRADGGPA